MDDDVDLRLPRCTSRRGRAAGEWEVLRWRPREGPSEEAVLVRVESGGREKDVLGIGSSGRRAPANVAVSSMGVVLVVTLTRAVRGLKGRLFGTVLEVITRCCN